MKVTNETKVGALTALAITILIIGYSFLQGEGLFSKNAEYVAIYNRVDGLNPSAQVMINGFAVGRVTEIRMLKDQTGRIHTKFAIDNEILIPSNSIAEIVSSDLLGEKAIEITLGDSPSYLETGDTMMAMVQMGLTTQIIQELYPIRDKLSAVFASVDSVVEVIRVILSDDLVGSSLASVDGALESVARTARRVDSLVAMETGKIDVILSNIQSISTNIKNNNEELSNIITNFSSFSDTLAQADIGATLTQTKQSLEKVNQIIAQVERGEGSLGLLLKDPLLYQNLQDASQNLDALIEDIKNNPSRYLNMSVIRIGGGGGGRKTE